MTTTQTPAPGFVKKPHYFMSLEDAACHILITIEEQRIASSERAIRVREASYDDVFYLPKADIQMDLLTPSATTSHCPFKGYASYWNYSAADAQITNVAWSYEAPYTEARVIQGYIAFYTNKTQLLTNFDSKLPLMSAHTNN